MWDTVWKIIKPQPWRSGMVCSLTSPGISANSHQSGKFFVVVMVWVFSHMPIHSKLVVFKHVTYVWVGCGMMQFERCYSINYGLVAWFAHLHHLGFQPILTNLLILCGGTGVSVQPYAHSQQLMVLKHLIYVLLCMCKALDIPKIESKSMIYQKLFCWWWSPRSVIILLSPLLFDQIIEVMWYQLLLRACILWILQLNQHGPHYHYTVIMDILTYSTSMNDFWEKNLKFSTQMQVAWQRQFIMCIITIIYF